VRFLYGDSTESNLEFNYLAFLREVIDCSVVLVENELSLARTLERRRERERDAAALVGEIEELGRSAGQLSQRVAKEQADAPLGRAAAAIAAAASQAVERESAHVRSSLAADIAQLDARDGQLRQRSQEVLDKLLRAHDLPDATKVFEVAISGAGARATMRQATKLGLEASIGLEIPASSPFATPDLRVDRIVDGIEVNGLERGKWRKSERLVGHKLGRWHVTRVVLDDTVTVRVKETTEADAAGFDVTVARDGDITIERLDEESGRDLSIDHQNRQRLATLAERLELAVRSLETGRTGLSSFQVDGTPVADHPHPRAVAEKLIAAVAPVVQQIRQHSPTPGELVLRLPLGEDRREEIFVSTAELAKRWERLPEDGKAVFAPLQLAGDGEAQTQPRAYAGTPLPLPIARSGAASSVAPLPSAPSSAAAPTLPRRDASASAAPTPVPGAAVLSQGAADDRPKAST
jgi:hypothetical protein